jgi:hypothetical protein
MGFVWWLIIAFFWVIFLYFTMSVARSKGHSPLLWVCSLSSSRGSR